MKIFAKIESILSRFVMELLIQQSLPENLFSIFSRLSSDLKDVLFREELELGFQQQGLKENWVEENLFFQGILE